jgi:hypothetical protein
MTKKDLREKTAQAAGDFNVKQDPEAPIAAEIMAQAIMDIAAAMEKIGRSGLKRKAIVALIHDTSGLRKGDIELVLNNLESLRATWCTR